MQLGKIRDPGCEEENGCVVLLYYVGVCRRKEIREEGYARGGSTVGGCSKKEQVAMGLGSSTAPRSG